MNEKFTGYLQKVEKKKEKLADYGIERYRCLMCDVLFENEFNFFFHQTEDHNDQLDFDNWKDYCRRMKTMGYY